MKRRTLAVITGVLVVGIIITLVICLNNAIADDERLFILCHPDSGVFVRENPRKTALVAGMVFCGTEIKTDGRIENGFLHVIDLAAEQQEGWVFAGYVVDDVPRIRTYKAKADGRVIVRNHVDGKQIGRLRDGQTVTVYARTYMWAVTSRGFVMCDWLEMIDDGT